jgi:hypothetical protein
MCLGDKLFNSWGPIEMVPFEGLMFPFSVLIRVVFPDPFGPTMPTKVDSGKVAEIFFRMVLLPIHTDKFFTLIEVTIETVLY